MKTLGEIINLRQNKYAKDRKNPTFSDYWQGFHNGWFWGYQDLKEILEQNRFNLDVPVIDVVKTNADHIRSMTDEELAENFYDKKLMKNVWLEWLKQPYKEEA